MVRQGEPTTAFPGPTFLEMQEDVLTLVGYTATDAPAALLARVKRLLNTGAANLSRRFPHLCWVEKYTTITLIAGTSVYPLPSGFIRLKDPVVFTLSTDADDKGTPVFYLAQEYRNAFSNSTTIGEQYYTLFGADDGGPAGETLGQIEFLPAITSIAAADRAGLYYEGLDNQLVGDTDILALPSGLSGVVTSFAEWKILRTLGESKLSQESRDDWAGQVGEMEQMDLASRTNGGTRSLPAYQYSRKRYDNINSAVPRQ